jgi:hypothetical protein
MERMFNHNSASLNWLGSFAGTSIQLGATKPEAKPAASDYIRPMVPLKGGV